MPRRRSPIAEVDVSVGSPIFPVGVTVSARVPAARTEEAVLALVAIARAVEPKLKLRSHEMPRAEHVPGTTCAVDGNAGVYDDVGGRRVGY